MKRIVSDKDIPSNAQLFSFEELRMLELSYCFHSVQYDIQKTSMRPLETFRKKYGEKYPFAAQLGDWLTLGIFPPDKKSVGHAFRIELINTYTLITTIPRTQAEIIDQATARIEDVLDLSTESFPSNAERQALRIAAAQAAQGLPFTTEVWLERAKNEKQRDKLAIRSVAYLVSSVRRSIHTESADKINHNSGADAFHAGILYLAEAIADTRK